MAPKFFFCLFCLIVFQSLWAYERRDTINEVNDILSFNRNQTNHDNNQIIHEKYESLKRKIQEDIYCGNINAGISSYLLLDGLLNDNLEALQSLLFHYDEKNFYKNFAKAIDYNYAQKLAFALKENRLAFKTKFLIQNQMKLENCIFSVNGVPLPKNKFSFEGASGVPFYVGSYCQNKKFDIKKVISQPTQRTYSILFSDYKEIVFEKNLLELNIPNPLPAKYFR